MFGKKSKTLYEVLGVGRDATVAEITNAYQRVRAEMRGPDVWIHPLLAAKVKVAYETLRDPLKREAYDRKLASVPPPQAPPPAAVPHVPPPQEEVFSPPIRRPRTLRSGRSGWWGAGAGVGLVVLAAGAAGYFLMDDIDPQPEKEYSAAEIAERVSPYLGRLKGALVGGTRDLGFALATAENEMVTPCREMPAGMVFTLQLGAASPRAELARESEALGLCVIAVRGTAPDFTLRKALPAPGEALYAIVREGGGAPLPLRVTAGRAIADPNGHALQINAQAALPNGTPVFDRHARLVGLVAAPHGYGDGIVAALGSTRIAASRR